MMDLWRRVECRFFDNFVGLADPLCFHVFAGLIEGTEPLEQVGIIGHTRMHISPIEIRSTCVFAIEVVVCTVPRREDRGLIDTPTHDGVVFFVVFLPRNTHPMEFWFIGSVIAIAEKSGQWSTNSGLYRAFDITQSYREVLPPGCVFLADQANTALAKDYRTCLAETMY